MLVSVRASYPARALTALLGALLVPALPIFDAAPSRADDRGRQEVTIRIAAAEADAARVYRAAAGASRTYEKVRRATKRQRRTVNRLTDALDSKRHAYAELRRTVGGMAARQYRSGASGGLLPSAQLMLADSPEEFLAQTSSLLRGNRAAAQLAERAERARDDVARSKAAADRALERLRRDQARQNKIKRGIEAKLSRVERQVGLLLSAFGAPPAARGCATGPPAGPPPRRRSGWVAPVERYRLSAGYAERGRHWAHRHSGQDFAVDPGTPVRAAGAGTVTVATCGDGFGNQLLIRHDNGYYTQYAHLSLLQARPGQRVRPGEQIGLAGASGNASGPHLHFEVRVTPQYGAGVDPVPWLRERGVRL
ncbi:M23 family metallopeptidase [Streptomyces gobiensis]|uniref:M23 family metallopeptidase n=1 Tax=Streptomyces gobiensis TaxID=2875706 RepID=UPI001E4808DB|nr:M23 family metallopeptidase [Streptomyces gobiensis]UGY92698.1 M23 family metallopeptidase [Streptomyces gobiensis]